MLSLKFLPFAPTLTYFATERAKETGQTEKFLEKYRFCPKIDQSAVQMCCNRFRAKRGRISAASSASARLSEKVEAAGTPDWSVSGRRHSPNRGCQRS